VADHFMFRFFLHREQGRLAELAESTQKIDSWYPDDLLWQSMLNLMVRAVPHSAKPSLAVGDIVDNIERDSANDGTAVAAGALLATSAEILWNPDYAERVYAALVPYAEFNAVLPNSRHFHCLGSISHSLGLLARALGRWNASEQHFESAIDMHSRIGAAPYLAHSRYAYARMKTERNNSGDRARAQQLASRARETAEELGMSVLARRANTLQAELESN
jgi:tetratricopeptide (TPR) repeat protein